MDFRSSYEEQKHVMIDMLVNFMDRALREGLDMKEEVEDVVTISNDVIIECRR